MTIQNRVPEGVPTGGQFAASARSEATVALSASTENLDYDVSLDDARDLTDPSLSTLLVNLAEHYREHPDRPCCDGETTLRDWADAGFYTPGDFADTPLTRALDAANLPGTYMPTGTTSADYSDEHGHFYSLSHHGSAVQVTSQDTDAQALYMPFDAKTSPMQPEEIVDALRSCQASAADIRGFNTAATKHFGTGPDANSPYAIEPTYDHDAGTVEIDGIVIGDFTRDDREMRGATMKIWVDKGANPMQTTNQSFTLHRDTRGEVRVYRGEDVSEPLALWEEKALDGHIADRTRRSGAVLYTRALFRDALDAAEKQG